MSTNPIRDAESNGVVPSSLACLKTPKVIRQLTKVIRQLTGNISGCGTWEAGSYLRRIDFVYHSTPGLRVIKKKKGCLVDGRIQSYTSL